MLASCGSVASWPHLPELSPHPPVGPWGDIQAGVSGPGTRVPRGGFHQHSLHLMKTRDPPLPFLLFSPLCSHTLKHPQCTALMEVRPAPWLPVLSTPTLETWDLQASCWGCPLTPPGVLPPAALRHVSLGAQLAKPQCSPFPGPASGLSYCSAQAGPFPHATKVTFYPQDPETKASRDTRPGAAVAGMRPLHVCPPCPARGPAQPGPA